MTTLDQLVADLVEAGAPDDLVIAAKNFAFHDFKSPSATPITDLVMACERNGLGVIADRARNGDYDASKEEAEEWRKSPDGVSTIEHFAGGM